MHVESDAEVAYARLGALCQAIKNELQNDLTIHDANVLPAYVNLPQVTAAEYSQVRLDQAGVQDILCLLLDQHESNNLSAAICWGIRSACQAAKVCTWC